jgi:hypothetical protein
MIKFLQAALLVPLLAVTVFAQPPGTPQNTAYKGGGESGGSVFTALFSDWLIWALLIGLFVLIGVFVWMRNRSSED